MDVIVRHLTAIEPGCVTTVRGVDILKSENGGSEGKPMLNIKYTDVKRSSPNFETEHESTLSHFVLDFSKVHIKFHQDAISGLMKEITKLLNVLHAKAKHMTGSADPGQAATLPDEEERGSLTKKLSGLVTDSIPFCWLFAIISLCKKWV